MAKITKAVDLKTLSPVLKTYQGSTIHMNLSAPTVNAKPAVGGLPGALNADGTDPNANVAAFHIVRNNRVIGPFPDFRVAVDTIDWIASRERELGTDI